MRPAIYSNWIEDNYRKWSNGGMIVNNGQNNSTSVNPIDEIVANWNEFVRKVGGGCYYDANGNTLYGYLDNEEENYEGWDSSRVHAYKLRNSLDL